MWRPRAVDPPRVRRACGLLFQPCIDPPCPRGTANGGANPHEDCSTQGCGPRALRPRGRPSFVAHFARAHRGKSAAVGIQSYGRALIGIEVPLEEFFVRVSGADAADEEGAARHSPFWCCAMLLGLNGSTGLGRFLMSQGQTARKCGTQSHRALPHLGRQPGCTDGAHPSCTLFSEEV